ncbi:MAG TPA: flagellar basal body-associated FliL family protein [Rhodopila sp.]|jgi:flagellar FliL protein|nr:flagellar basal body-associated FliL family protein [Rhodopila sp.]
MAALDTLDANEVAAIPPRAGAGRPLKANRKKLLIIGAASLLGLAALGIATTLIIGMTSHSAAKIGAVDLPEMVSNLNAGPHRTAFVRLKAQLELANSNDEAAVIAAEPRIQDLFQTYLRDMRPEELRGSAGSYRLREELIARANIAVAPARVTEILFIELLVQ